MADRDRYGQDEVRAIVDRALRNQDRGDLTHDDLIAIGAEVGLSQQAMERAALEVSEARFIEEARARVLGGRRRGVAIHAGVFAAVNLFLFTINFLTTPGEWWVLFPVFGWGLGLLLHAGFGFSRQISERRMEREKHRLQTKRRLADTVEDSVEGRIRQRIADELGAPSDLVERERSAARRQQ